MHKTYIKGSEPGLPLTLPRLSEISEKKLEHIGKIIFDIPFMIQSHAESVKKILGAVLDLPAN